MGLCPNCKRYYPEGEVPHRFDLNIRNSDIILTLREIIAMSDIS